MTRKICAPMTGTIFKILVEPGQVFSSGEAVAILESMKMEIPIEAESAGTVEAVLVKEGDVIDEDGTILTYT